MIRHVSSVSRCRRGVRVLRGLILAAAGLAAGLGVAGWVASFWVPLPEELLRPADRTLTLLDRAGREIAVVPTGRAREADTVALAEMGSWLPRVTVALEDRRFWEHGGVDARAWAGALWRNLRAGRVLSGGSTIAQQLVKAARGRTGSRLLDKLYEALAAQRLARLWSRERILEEYLNRIDYGNRRLGPRAAARAYFGKEPVDLSVAEAAFLAGLPQAPTRHNPWLHPEAALQRYRLSLRTLAAVGVIEANVVRELAAAPPPVVRRVPPNEAPHFVNALVARAPGQRGRVMTTLDLPLQRAVAALTRAHIARLAGRGVGQAAVVVIDNREGAVRAYVGSADFAARDGQIDGVLLPRSGGSVLKPFLYVDAIEQRVLTAATVLPDTPDAIRAVYADYDPQNFDQRFLGPVRAREALGNSLNVPAVGVLSRVGARPFFSHLAEWGFRFPRDLREYGAGMILGHAEPRLVDLAAAFAGIAAGGRVPAWRLLESEPRTGRRVASVEAAAIVADMLCDDEARRRAFGRDSALALPVRVPCKTGTSSGFRDAWTVGSTGRHTVAVWAGNFDGRPMAAASSIEAAAPLWREVIEELLRNDDAVPMPEVSARLVARDVCRLTGLRPTRESPGTVREWFLVGTEPRADAGDWLRPRTDGRAALVLPPEYRAWCASAHNYLGAIVAPPGEVTIRSPADGATYALEAGLPRAQQMLRLEATAPAGEPVTWRVDGEVAGLTDATAWWSLAEGTHVAEATAGGQRAAVQFTVRP